MTDRQKRAAELFLSGCNCAEATAGAFAKDMQMTEDEVIALSSAFGGGFARTRMQCGAVSGMGLVIGKLRFSSDDTHASNGEVYSLTREAIKRFTDVTESTNCMELLKNVSGITQGGNPDERTSEYYAKRPCVFFVELAVKIVEELLF